MKLKTLNLTLLIISIIMLIPTIQFVYASPLSTFYLSGGIYPHGVSYTIWREGTTYYAKNAYGRIEFKGTNLTKVVNDAINALPSISVQLPDPSTSTVTTVTGWIHLDIGKFYLSSPIEVPLGARIIISGCGTTQQMIKNGINGGTQIINSGSTPAFVALQKKGSVYCTGSIIYLRDIEFVQNVNLATNSTACVNLDGMAQGKLENVQIVSSYTKGQITGTGLSLYTNWTTGDTGGDTLFEQVQVCGFNTLIKARIDHWEAHQLDLANATLALNWSVCLQNHLYGVHIFQVKQIMEVHNGFTDYGHASIEGLYLEDIDDDTETIKWNILYNFTGIIYIENTNVNSCDSTYLWTVNTTNPHGNCSLWFDKLMTVNSVVFPSVTSPTLSSGTNITNTFMQTVEVNIWGGTVTNIEINGLQVAETEAYGLLLRPSDRILLTYSVEPNWVWRAVSAERLHYLDP